MWLPLSVAVRTRITSYNVCYTKLLRELRGEKIDIINWTPDIARFACSALAPAEVTRVYVDNEEESLEIIVPDDQLSLAISYNFV